jgi:hypothetical protein
MLARAGFVVVLMPVNVSGFRLVLARGWHGQTVSLAGFSDSFRTCHVPRPVLDMHARHTQPVSNRYERPAVEG